MQVVRYFFLHASLLLILAHSFVPHGHDSEDGNLQLDSIEESKPLDLLDWLATVFQQDLGEDHLENYRPAYKFLATFSPPLLSNQLSRTSRPIAVLVQDFEYLPYQVPQYLTHHWPFIENRGPPFS